MYSCSYGNSNVDLLMCFSKVIVPSIVPYSCLLFRTCSAYDCSGLVCFMYRECSLYLCCRLRLVCPMYDNLHVLQVSLCTPLFSCSFLFLCTFGFVTCCKVLVFLKATRTFVCLNMSVIFLINGL